MIRSEGQLPPGPHGLTREQVRESQRARMLAAMVDAVAEHGYADLTVAHVIKGARVSRETFYQHFQDKRAAFLDTFDHCSRELALRIGERAMSAGDERLDRLGAALAAYLGELAERPKLAHTLLIDVHAAGEEAMRRRLRSFDGFVAVIVAIAGAETDDQQFACEAFAASVSAMVTMRVAAGKGPDLMELHAPLIRLASDLLATWERA